MTRLGPLFDAAPGYGLPRARKSDHDSSHAAADAQERTGQAERDGRLTLEALRRWPGSTSRELADLSGLDRYMVARRLPDLARKGYARKVKVEGKPIRWWPR